MPTTTPRPPSSEQVAAFDRNAWSRSIGIPGRNPRNPHLNAEIAELLKRVNHSVNMSIIPTHKSYGRNLEDGWTIAPERGDCNDYAVTKRHELIENGLSSRALRLSVVRTASGIGHLVLVVVTTKGDIVMDDLTEGIRSWQSTHYHWLKIQSATDSKFWYEIKRPAVRPSVSQANRRVRLADR
jgi:predicted transglutaminase-like cysteine proteinase